MATSSITEPFYCKDAKAANTIVRLMFSENVPASWCASESSNVHVVKYASEAEEKADIRRMKALMRRKMRSGRNRV